MDSLPDCVLADILRRVSADTGSTRHLLVSKRWLEIGREEQVFFWVSRPWKGLNEDLVSHLLTFPSLTALQISPDALEKIDDAFFRSLCSQLPSLRHFTLLPSSNDVNPQGGSAKHSCQFGNPGIREMVQNWVEIRTLALRTGQPGYQYDVPMIQLTRLQHLELFPSARRGGVKWIPPTIEPLKQLKVLKIKSLSMTHLPAGVSRLPLMQELSLNCPSLQRLPEDIGKLKNLTSVRLTSPRLARFPDSFWELKQLKTLVIQPLEASRLAAIPEDISNLQSLKDLKLANLGVLKLPAGICSLSALTSIKISSFSELKLLPRQLGRLNCLQEIVLEDCRRLESLPDSLPCLSSLERLWISRCPKLEDKDKVVAKMTWVSDIKIQGCNKIPKPKK